jgi:hypothetical protein
MGMRTVPFGPVRPMTMGSGTSADTEKLGTVASLRGRCRCELDAEHKRKQ